MLHSHAFSFGSKLNGIRDRTGSFSLDLEHYGFYLVPKQKENCQHSLIQFERKQKPNSASKNDTKNAWPALTAKMCIGCLRDSRLSA